LSVPEPAAVACNTANLGTKQPHLAFRLEAIAQQNGAPNLRTLSVQCRAFGVLEATAFAVQCATDVSLEQMYLTLDAKALVEKQGAPYMCSASANCMAWGSAASDRVGRRKDPTLRQAQFWQRRVLECDPCWPPTGSEEQRKGDRGEGEIESPVHSGSDCAYTERLDVLARRPL